MTTDRVVVIGAGPAGMAAAAALAGSGAQVLLLDDQPALGGQVYRGMDRIRSDTDVIPPADDHRGRYLLEGVRRQQVTFVPRASVWHVSPSRELGYSADGQSRLLQAPAILLATGAMERPYPVPGWTLPGVMTAGAAQTLLKTSGIAADGAVFAGTGPLLYLAAYQYVQAGLTVTAILDTTAKANRRAALRHLPGALRRVDLLAKGWHWQQAIKKSGTSFISDVSDLKIEGQDAAERICYRIPGEDWRSITTPYVFLHQGVVPNVNLAMSAGITHVWSTDQLCWQAETDAWGCTNIDGIAVAGDGAKIGGAVAAEASGRIAAFGILEALGHINRRERDRRAERERRELRREAMLRPFLDRRFRPPPQFRLPTEDKTILCRCEEITLKEARDAVGKGLTEPNRLKSYCRIGMGPCQGRFCGLTVMELLQRETQRKPTEIGYFRLRPPIKPLALSELTDFNQSNEAGNGG